MSAAHSETGSMLPRLAFMDAARGLAVAGMVILHFVPTEHFSGESTGPAGALMNTFEGAPAATFCLLAGMAWALKAEGRPESDRTYIWRRFAALAVAGIIFHIKWSTEILLPLALMMICTMYIRSLGRNIILAAIAFLSILLPIVATVFAGVISSDWLPDGGHVADSTFGWATVRYLVFDGNYPLVPWLAFPLVGVVIVETRKWASIRVRSWFISSCVILAIALAVTWWADTNQSRLGCDAEYLANTWVPATIPFLLISGSTAMAVVSGLAWFAFTRGAIRDNGPIACLGRASLTHYIAHILLLYLPLRALYGGEDWPIHAGIAAAGGYILAAMMASVVWFRKQRRGPLEELLVRLSGDGRPGNKAVHAGTVPG